jgi:hypothetical protein
MYPWQVWSYQLTNIFGCQSRAAFVQIILDDFDHRFEKNNLMQAGINIYIS